MNLEMEPDGVHGFELSTQKATEFGKAAKTLRGLQLQLISPKPQKMQSSLGFIGFGLRTSLHCLMLQACS